MEKDSVMSDSLWPRGPYSPWNSPGQNTGVGSLIPSPGDLPNPGIKPRSPAMQDSLPAESQGKPENTGEDGLSFLQEIFLTQELNWGLPHCRRILYQLSYQGSQTTKWSERMINKIQNEYFCAGGGQTRGFKDIGDVHNILKLGGGYRTAHLFLIS